MRSLPCYRWPRLRREIVVWLSPIVQQSRHVAEVLLLQVWGVKVTFQAAYTIRELFDIPLLWSVCFCASCVLTENLSGYGNGKGTTRNSGQQRKGHRLPNKADKLTADHCVRQARQKNTEDQIEQGHVNTQARTRVARQSRKRRPNAPFARSALHGLAAELAHSVRTLAVAALLRTVFSRCVTADLGRVRSCHFRNRIKVRCLAFFLRHSSQARETLERFLPDPGSRSAPTAAAAAAFVMLAKSEGSLRFMTLRATVWGELSCLMLPCWWFRWMEVLREPMTATGAAWL